MVQLFCPAVYIIRASCLLITHGLSWITRRS